MKNIVKPWMLFLLVFPRATYTNSIVYAETNIAGANLDINYLAGIPLKSYIEYIKYQAAPLIDTLEYQSMVKDLTGQEVEGPSDTFPEIANFQ